MRKTVSRRWLLERGSIAGAVGLAGCATGSLVETTGEGDSDETAGVGNSESQPNDGESADESEFSGDIREMARRVGTEIQQSVVEISFDGGRGGGTGWFLDDGHIVTNSHIARQTETVQFETFGGETGTAERVGYHPDMTPDLALLETDVSGVPSLSKGDSSTLEAGQPLVIVGHPGRVGKWVISLGAFQEYREGIDWLLTDAPTNQGNSGSPLVTLDGNVVGCVSGTTYPNGRPEGIVRSETVFEEFPDPEKLATANPIETVEKWVAEWK
ncbi:S1C family serine protease [Halorussus amylolyticus]|uniref:S1C family serine protease n=1 Tax=Halorussus amylolyticus TaxID=1126242 RepID=UPI00138ED4E7|nr:serine protease [Halorussus amylolyticus]